MSEKDPIKTYISNLEAILFRGFEPSILKERPDLREEWLKATRRSQAKVRTLRGRPDYRKWIAEAQQKLKEQPQNVEEIIDEGLDKFELSPHWLHIVAEDVCDVKFPRRYATHVDTHVEWVGFNNEVVIEDKQGCPLYEFHDFMDEQIKNWMYYSLGMRILKIIQDSFSDIQLDNSEKMTLGKFIIDSKRRRIRPAKEEFIAPKLGEKADWYDMYQNQNMGYIEIGVMCYEGNDFDEESRFINKVKRGVHWYAKKFGLPFRDGRKYISDGISRKKELLP